MRNTILKVKQNPEKEVPLDVMAESIVAISNGIRKITSTRINDKALHLLIQHAAPSVGTYPTKRISVQQIKAVLQGIESLERTYLKKK